MKYKVNGPTGSMISGNWKEYSEDPLGFLDHIRLNYKDVARVRFFQYPFYILMDPTLIYEALVKKNNSFQNGKNFMELEPFADEGLLSNEQYPYSEIEDWTNSSLIEHYVNQLDPKMKRIIDVHLTNWEQTSERVLTEDMMNLTLDIISNKMFSLSTYEIQKTKGNEMDTTLGLATKRIRTLFGLPHSRKLSEYHHIEATVSKFEKVVYTIITYRRQNPDIVYHDILAKLMNGYKDEEDHYVVNKQLREEVITQFFRGHVMMANAIVWTLYNICKYPAVKQEVLDEIDKFSENGRLSIKTVENLTYLKAVFQESIRLNPPLYLFNRKAINDVEIGPIQIQKGEGILLSSYITHKLDAYYKSPLSFYPQRFLNHSTDSLPKFSFFPFGLTKNMYSNNQLFMLESMLIIGNIVSRFDLQWVRDVGQEPHISLRPNRNMEMKIIKR
ncbi:cytochrome P450 [Bacillus spongiae]|uniref:Cytochrome P450 n=1 Tax=Bacillus spongiae TaxID=2683610 RepID=A0ABU8HH82_9BACI